MKSLRSPFWNRIVAVFGIVPLSIALAVSFQKTRADWMLQASTDATSMRKACEQDPGNAQCWVRLARAEELAGINAKAEWDKAIQLNPRNPFVLSEAAIGEELSGDMAGSEKLLLQAAHYNHLWLPRWALANYYFRRSQWNDFWKWTRLALERSYGDRTAIFQLCRQAGGRSAFLVENVLPPGYPEVFLYYLWFTNMERNPEEIQIAADAFLKNISSKERKMKYAIDAFTLAIDQLLIANQAPAAMNLWNRLAAEKLIPYPAYTEDRPLVNASLATPLLNQAFDWRLHSYEGVESNIGTPPGSALFRLSGHQGQSIDLLAQMLWLPAGKHYRFQFEVQTYGLPESQSGVFWRLVSTAIKESLLGEPFHLYAREWETVTLKVEPLSEAALLTLSLTYQRQSGTVRSEGEVRIRNLSWKALP